MFWQPEYVSLANKNVFSLEIVVLIVYVEMNDFVFELLNCRVCLLDVFANIFIHFLEYSLKQCSVAIMLLASFIACKAEQLKPFEKKYGMVAG